MMNMLHTLKLAGSPGMSNSESNKSYKSVEDGNSKTKHILQNTLLKNLTFPNCRNERIWIGNICKAEKSLLNNPFHTGDAW